ncbi:MAG: hypothetical protein V4543_06105 [Bacteroidota bacterium]
MKPSFIAFSILFAASIQLLKAQSPSSGLIPSQYSPSSNSGVAVLQDHQYEPEEPELIQKNCFKAAPCAIIGGKFAVGYVRKITKQLSVGAEIDYLGFDIDGMFSRWGGDGNSFGYLNQGVKVSPFVRIYPFNKYVQPFYLQANICGGYYNGKAYASTDHYYRKNLYKDFDFGAIGGSFWLGFQFVNKNGFTIDFGGGLQYFTMPGYNYDLPSGKDFNSLSSSWEIGPGCPAAGRLDIGYSF